MRSLAEQAKHRIAQEPLVVVEYRDGDAPRPLSLSRDRFNEMSADRINRMKLLLQRAMSDANLKASQIDRNTTIPASRSTVVEASQKGQTHIEVKVFQGEAPYVRDNILIGSYKVPIPHNSKAHEPVDVRFTHDSSGVLEVISSVLSSQVSKMLIIENAPGAMSVQDIAKRFKELEKIKVHPRDLAVKETLISRASTAYAYALGTTR